MVNALTKAHINLFALLRNLEDLCGMDEESKSLIKDKNLSILFTVKGGPQGRLIFKNGKCHFERGKGSCSMKLYFKSPEHFNSMIDGKANPIPLKGLTRIKFLTNEFTKITDRLAYYLKPTDELLINPDYFRINTYLTAYTAFFALVEIGNTDPIGQLNAGRIPDGIISISVDKGPAVHINVKEGVLQVEKGTSDKPRATMVFNSAEVANAILNGKSDTYTCMGNGSFSVHGYIPMLDNMNKLLSQVPEYLK